MEYPGYRLIIQKSFADEDKQITPDQTAHLPGAVFFAREMWFKIRIKVLEVLQSLIFFGHS